MNKNYQEMSPNEKREADRSAARNSANETAGSEDAMRARGIRPMEPKKMNRAKRKTDR
jgi:hypothetical protein